MDGNSRIMHRIRPRPYDLRRKVLLKNFLREQMTYIPPMRGLIDTTMEVSSDLDFSQGESTSRGNEENIETPNDHCEDTQPDISHSEPISSSSTAVIDKNENDLHNSISDDTANTARNDKIPQSKFSRLSVLLKLKSVTRKKRKRGVSKAKQTYKTIKSPIKIVLDKKKVELENPVPSKRSFFSLFKSRRQKKTVNIKKEDLPCLSPITRSVEVSSTSNQSVQTDVSWINETYKDLEQTNKCLKEENRLLSESLSCIMSDMNFKISSKKNSFESLDSTNSELHMATTTEAQNSANLKYSSSIPSRKVISRTKLSCSKSVQENNGHPNYRHHSKSRDSSATSKFKFNSTTNLHGANINSSRISVISSNINHSPSLSSSNRQSVLKSLPINSGKTIVRRSSMPERTIREPVRQFLRPRSQSIRVLHYNSEILRNPNHETRYSHINRALALKNRPLKTIGQPIVRRSSMPERTSRKPYRPVHRHRSINSHDFSNISRKSFHRSNNNGEYSQSVNFQNLPNEAFY